MTSPHAAKRPRSLALVALYLASTLFFFSLWSSRHTQISGWAEKYCYGELELPFAYRTLVPSFIRLSVAPFDAEGRDAWAAEAVANRPWLGKLLTFWKTRPDFLAELVVLMTVQLLSILGFALVLRKLFALLYQDSGPPAELAPVLALTMALPVYWNGAYVYDLPQLFLFSAALLALARERWKSFYVVAALAFLNKETSCLLTLVFLAVHFDRMERRRLLRHLLAQLLLFLGLRVALVVAITPAAEGRFGSSTLPNHLLTNLTGFWTSELLQRFAPQVVALLLLAAMLRHLREGPRFLRRAIVLFPPLVAAYFWGGLWGEIRVFGELFPIAFLLVYGGAFATFGRPLEVRPEQMPTSSDDATAARLGAWIAVGLYALLAIFLFVTALAAWSVSLYRI